MAASTTRSVNHSHSESSRKHQLIVLKPPLLLPLFSLLPDSSIVVGLLYTLVDILSAYSLIQIADSGEAQSARLFTSPRKDVRWDSVAIGAA